MYPMQCHAGFPLPIGVGKVDVCGLIATINDTTVASRITIIDDMNLPRDAAQGRILPDQDQEVPIIDLKVLANGGGNLEVVFQEPIRLRRGASVINASNLLGGRVMLFTR